MQTRYTELYNIIDVFSVANQNDFIDPKLLCHLDYLRNTAEFDFSIQQWPKFALLTPTLNSNFKKSRKKLILNTFEKPYPKNPYFILLKICSL